MDQPVKAHIPGETTSAPPKRRARVRLVLTLAAGLAAIGAGVYGQYWYRTGRFIETTDNAYLQAEQVAMAPVVSGQIAEVYVRDNQDVAAGQPLVKIDPRRYELAVREAQATVDARQADLTKSGADLQQQGAVIAQAQADLDNARANADLAQKEFDRSASLAARGLDTEQKREQNESALAQAKSVTTLKSAALDAARQQVSALQAQVELARAQLASAKESLSQADIDLDDTVLRSPTAGRIGDRTVQVGQFVQPGTRLLTVVPVDQIYLVANFKETQIGGILPGQPATVSVDAYPGMALKGVVDSMAPGTGAQFALLPPENATGNFTKIVQRVPVRIRLDVPKSGAPPLVPGLSIEVAVDTKAAPAGAVALAE